MILPSMTRSMFCYVFKNRRGSGGGGEGWENVLVSETLNFEIPIDVL